MQETFFKVFFSKTKEKKWLDDMGENGYLLTKIKDSKYYFEHSEEHTYSYSIENLGVPPESEKGIEYISSYKEKNVDFIFKKGTWSYFVSADSEIEIDPSVYKRNNEVYFWRMVYLAFFAIAFAVVFGYQLFATDFLVNIGHKSDGGVAYIPEESYLDIIQNAVFKVLNRTYFVPFRVIFGLNDASVVISLVLPAVIILGLLFAFNLDEYLNVKQCQRKNIKIKEISMESLKGDTETDAKQAI